MIDAQGDVTVHLGLDFHMDQYPLLTAVEQHDPDQLIHTLLAQLGVANDFLEFLVQERIVFGPVDLAMNLWKAE